MKPTKTYLSYLERNRCVCEFETFSNKNKFKVRHNDCPIHKPYKPFRVGDGGKPFSELKEHNVFDVFYNDVQGKIYNQKSPQQKVKGFK